MVWRRCEGTLFLLTTLLAPLKKRSFDKLFRLLFFPLYLLTEEERMLLPLLWFMACFSESKENWTGKLKLEGKAKWDDAKWSDATWTVRSDEAMRLERRRHEVRSRSTIRERQCEGDLIREKAKFTWSVRYDATWTKATWGTLSDSTQKGRGT